MLQKFFDEAGHQLRVVMGEDGEPRFVAKDVCEALELTDTSKALSPLEEDEKGTSSIRTPGGNQQLLVVTEPGLYSLIINSRKPGARKFRRWVFHDVLPSIRRTGSYSMVPHVDKIQDRTEAAFIAMRGFEELRDRATNPADRALMASCLDHVRNHTMLLFGSGGQPTKQQPMTVVDYAVQIFGVSVKEAKEKEISLGNRASNAYFKRHGERPKKNYQLVNTANNGKPVSGVNVYPPEDFDLLHDVCVAVFGERVDILPALKDGDSRGA